MKPIRDHLGQLKEGDCLHNWLLNLNRAYKSVLVIILLYSTARVDSLHLQNYEIEWQHNSMKYNDYLIIETCCSNSILHQWMGHPIGISFIILLVKLPLISLRISSQN